MAIITFTDGDATPSVSDYNRFETNNSSDVTITDFDDGEAGQEITIVFKDTKTTVQSDGTNIKLQGNLDFGPSAVDDTLTLVLTSGGTWVETGRSINS